MTDTTTPELIEKVARAIFKQRYLATNPDAVLAHGAKAWQVCQLDAQDAITALADHQPAAEPVGYIIAETLNRKHEYERNGTVMYERPHGMATMPLYAAPQPAPDHAATLQRLIEALEPFAACCDQINDDEDDEEWAKFRLLIKDYRKARKAIAQAKGT